MAWSETCLLLVFIFHEKEDGPGDLVDCCTGENTGSGSKAGLVSVPASLLPGRVTSCNLLNLSEPWFPHPFIVVRISVLPKP